MEKWKKVRREWDCTSGIWVRLVLTQCVEVGNVEWKTNTVFALLFVWTKCNGLMQCYIIRPFVYGFEHAFDSMIITCLLYILSNMIGY